MELRSDYDMKERPIYPYLDGKRATAKLTWTGKKLLGIRACFVKEEGKVWFE